MRNPRGAVLLLCLLIWFPGWHAFGKESDLSDDGASLNEDETIQKKEELEEPLQPELSAELGLKTPSQTTVDDLVVDCTKDDQSTSPDCPNIPLAESEPLAELEQTSQSVTKSSEETPSTLSTSYTPPFSQSDVIENSSADDPIVISNEAEQSDPDCDTGEAVETDPQSGPSSFVSPTESLDQPIENISSSHGKIKITKSDLDINIPVADSGSNKQKLASNASERIKKEQTSDTEKSGDLEPTAAGNSKDPGDIPTFDEWKKQVLEVEKEKSQSMHPSSNGAQITSKKVQKNRNNYASVECGAKLLAANPEAKSTSAILIENMDLYMLNPCSTKIWFVIELCEPIQVKQLDIANYELFSSTPKDFLVSISDRYPTNKWVKLGTFHARDERNVQSFPLDEQMYAKYVKMFIKYLKVELISHFGSEHFCPLSLIRVFGTSMVEEYEESVDSHYQHERQDPYDEDYDYPLDYNTREDKASKNLLGSATNAILNMVNNLAANMLGANTEGHMEIQGNNVSSFDNITEQPETDPQPTQSETTKMLEPTLDPSARLPSSEVALPNKEQPEPEKAEENLIVQLVQEEEEEPRQSTVTLLGDDDQEEDKLAWFESETQIYCSELMTICCLSSFSEFLYKWCSVAMALHRQHSKMVERNRDNGYLATHQPLAVPTEEIPANVVESPKLEDLVSKVIKQSHDLNTVSLPDSLPMESSVTKSLQAIELEPSYTQMVSQSDFLELTSEEKTVSTTTSSDVTKFKAEQTEEQTPESTFEVPHKKEKTETPLPVETATMSAETFTVSKVIDTETNEVTGSTLPITSTQAVHSPELPTTVVDKDIVEIKGSLSEILKPTLTEGLEPSPTLGFKEDEQPTDEALLSASALGGLQRTATDFYAELQNSTELGYANGNLVHGSNQKESVFMRLNNRIKALEVNMSLSSRYLEELSQRYRRQMDEMQKAFNKTIIKLQNTARLAEEQDQRQTESIQLLQSQLTNMTHLVFNLSETVSELKREVSDRQSYLVVALVLCVILGLMVCMQRCRNASQLSEDFISSIPKSHNFPSPKRCFSSYDDMNLKRRTSLPLVRSKSFQLSSKEVDPNDFYIVEPLKFSPEKKKKRCKYKGENNIETIKPTDAPHPVANGDLKTKKPFTNQRDFSNMGEVFHSSHKGPPSEGSSETSSQSDESYFCGIAACTNLCNGQPQKTKSEKRALKRRRSKLQDQGKLIKSLIQTKSGSMPSLHDIIKSNKDITVGTFGVTTVSGHI